MKGAAVRNWVSYGFNQVNLTADVIATKNKSSSTYGQIAAKRTGNITFKKLNFLNAKTNRKIGVATVAQEVAFEHGPYTHRVILDREMLDLDPAAVIVLNLN